MLPDWFIEISKYCIGAIFVIVLYLAKEGSRWKSKKQPCEKYDSVIKYMNEVNRLVSILTTEMQDFKTNMSDNISSLKELILTKLKNLEKRVNVLEDNIFNKKKISQYLHCLLIEDNKSVGNMMREYLNKYYNVTWVKSCEAGIESLQNCIFDFALVDISLPQKSGIEFWEYCNKNNFLINKINGHKKLKIVTYTAYKNVEQIPSNMEFIQKPFVWSELKNKINYVLED